MRFAHALTVAAVGAAVGLGLPAGSAQAAPTAECAGAGFNYWQDPRASTETAVYWQIYVWSCSDSPISVRPVVSGAEPLECRTLPPGGVANWGVYTAPDGRPGGWEHC
jgi:hypothetical protein